MLTEMEDMLRTVRKKSPSCQDPGPTPAGSLWEPVKMRVHLGLQFRQLDSQDPFYRSTWPAINQPGGLSQTEVHLPRSGPALCSKPQSVSGAKSLLTGPPQKYPAWPRPGTVDRSDYTHQGRTVPDWARWMNTCTLALFQTYQEATMFSPYSSNCYYFMQNGVCSNKSVIQTMISKLRQSQAQLYGDMKLQQSVTFI